MSASKDATTANDGLLPPSERPAYGGTPARERDLRAQGRRTVRKLLDAAMEVFARRGYHATRVDDIVQRAKTSHGTFYLYFSNKEDLLNTLILHCTEEMAKLIDALGPISPDEAGREELRTWLKGFVELYRYYGPVVRAWTEAAETVSPEFAQVGGEMLASFTSRLADQIAEANPGGQPDPWLAAVAFVAMIERVYYYVFTRQVEIDEEAVTEALAMIIHRGVYGADGDGRPRKRT